MTNSKEYYEALIAKDPEYEGVFFVGVKSTGVFCRPTCAARKPKFEHCEFFDTAEEALLASYRPCKRCRPLSLPTLPEEVRRLVEMVESQPEHRWGDGDLRDQGIDPSTARRQFKRAFGMTFVQYARARRMGMAMKEIRKGSPVIEAQLTSGYESGSGFRDAFTAIMGEPPAKQGKVTLLYAQWLDTPLGPMLAIGDEEALYLLEFVDRRGLEREIERLRKRTRSAIVPGSTPPLKQISRELSAYFAGQMGPFTVPFKFVGSPFQQQVWKELMTIPPGEVRSYSEMAERIGRPSAVRAVAAANGANQLAIVVPCHRVIGRDGKLTGYGGGLARKEWLLRHERENR